MTSVYVAAGSNIEPVVHLQRALAVLADHYPGLRCSSAYRNRAAGFDGDDFVNLVLAFDTADGVHEVIDHLHAAETACGRARNAARWAPRAMDLDILLYGDLVCDEPGLIVPRPDLVRRAYMLGPMAELAPELVHPVLGSTMGELWSAFDRGAHPMCPVEFDWAAGRKG